MMGFPYSSIDASVAQCVRHLNHRTKQRILASLFDLETSGLLSITRQSEEHAQRICCFSPTSQDLPHTLPDQRKGLVAILVHGPANNIQKPRIMLHSLQIFVIFHDVSSIKHHYFL
jgi:hypothetical protein